MKPQKHTAKQHEEMMRTLHSVDVIFMSHSGGKDSQAALARIKELGLLYKVVIVHSDLKDMEWEHMTPWIESISFGLPVHEVSAEEDFFQMCRRVGRMPKAGNMQFCTENLKTKPIRDFIHQYMYDAGLTTAVNATGMRWQESKVREKKSEFCLSKGEHTSKMHMIKKHPEHTVYDWNVIFHHSEEEVYKQIKEAGQSVHRIYGEGFSRLSCAICVNGRVGEHQKAAELRPELARKMAQLERDIGKTIHMRSVKGKRVNWYFDEKFNIPVAPAVEENLAPNLLDLLGI